MMNFLHPWALAIGAAAISAPIIIHWLTRPRPQRMPLSTVRFVMQILQQRRARMRLRDWLILLLRVGAVALVAWAFARPLTGNKPLVSPNDSGNATRVVMLDVSQSTGAVSGGAAVLERGRAVAAEYLRSRSGLRAGLILAAATPETPVDRVSTNVASLREALSSVKSRPERLDVQPAINRAAQLLAGTPEDQTPELVIISDFQRSNWVTADFSPLPAKTKIQFESLAPAEAMSNIGIVRVSTAGRLEQGREARLEVEIGNYSRTPRDVQVEVTVGSAPYRVGGLCPPGVTTTLTTNVLLGDSGWLTGRARLMSITDALEADNERSFVVGIRPAPMYALITREPSRPHAASSHFLERALVPNRSRDAGNSPKTERVVRLDPAKLDVETLSTASMLVLDHPGRLSQESINQLSGLMRRGRGILYVAAEATDAVNLKLLADAAGADLKMPVEFQPVSGSGGRRGLFLVEWRQDQPPFESLGETGAALLSPLRFNGGLATRRIDGGLADDVLATFSDRSAGIVASACGAGALCVLNMDLAESNLVSSPAFVPMVGEIVGRLMSARGSNDANSSGETMSAYLPPEAGASKGLQVLGNGATGNATALEAGEFIDSGDMVLWRWAKAGLPGTYTIQRGEKTVFAVATAVPGMESDLTPMDPAVLSTRLAGGRSVHFQSAGQEPPKDDAWTWLLVGCCVCMISELAVLKAFRT